MKKVTNADKKNSFQSSILIGGIIPENKSHLVIDKPESVNLVKPPIIIINATKKVINKSQ